MSIGSLLEALLEKANEDLAVKHQQLAKQQKEGRDVGAATHAVGRSFERVEALQEGVKYRIPPDEPQREIAELAATLIALMLDGEDAAQKHVADALNLLEAISGQLPNESSKKRFLVFRQGAPAPNGGAPKPRPVFDLATEILAFNRAGAIQEAIRMGDSDKNAYPPITDGEILCVVEITNRNLNKDQVWVECINRPTYVSAAPRDNSRDPQ